MIDIDYLSRSYFWFDKPVPYKLKQNNYLTISPIKVKDSEMFLSWINIINIDKNNLKDAKYISMSYLDFIVDTFIYAEDEEVKKVSSTQLASILQLCLGWTGQINICFNQRKKAILKYNGIEINGTQFEDIRRIILYQNLLDFDDEYINPDVKKAIDEMNEVKSKNIVIPTLERKFAIITAHTGLSKTEQMEMTYRSHSMLFQEVYGEVDYMSVRTAVLVGNMFSKKPSELEDWIYKKKQSKYAKYFTSQETYSSSMGGSTAIRSDNSISSGGKIDISSFIN